MIIPSSQKVVVQGGGAKTILLNGDYTFTQVTIGGRDTNVITATARPRLENNNESDFVASEFEQITDGAVNLATTPPKRTFTIAEKMLSALKFADSGAGDYVIYIRQWNRANS